MIDWKTYKLGEIGEIIGGGTPSSTKKDYYNGNIAWITPRDLSNHGSMFISKGERSITELGLKNSSARILPPGTILLTSRAPIGYLAIAENEVCTNQGFKSIVIDDNFALNKFVYYLIKSNIDLLIQNASGSTFLEISGSVLKNLAFKFPPLSEQRSIASILSALDDKIELNLQMNKTLKEMAMALYRHWFVDFGPFQNRKFVESELGKIPEGWEVNKIGNIIETVGGGTPSTSKTEFWENGDILWYSPTDLTRENSLFSFDTAKKITPLGLQKSSSRLFPKNSLLMSSRATIGLLTINTEPACTNQGFITMLPNEKLSVYQLYFWVKQNMDLIISKSNGSTFKEINKSNFRDLNVIVGKNIEPYLRETESIFDLIKNNIGEIKILTTLRDTLLPKLISGQIRVKDAEQMVTANL